MRRSWASVQGGFTDGKWRHDGHGDTVLFQDEVNSVMSAALDNASVTALHNHFFYDEPRLFPCTSAAKLN